jgi:taurine dioxygenase
VNGVYTTHIVQLSKFESDSLLGMLYRHMENPQFQCRFKWRPGSIAFWDNRSTQHRGIWDFYPLRRVAHRVAIL